MPVQQNSGQLDYVDPSKTSGGSYMGKSFLKMENNMENIQVIIQMEKFFLVEILRMENSMASGLSIMRTALYTGN